METETNGAQESSGAAVRERLLAAPDGSLMAEALRLVENYAQPQIAKLIEPGTGVEAYVAIDSRGVHAVPASVFDQSRDKPARRKGTATLLELDSFVEHVKRFSDDDSVIFADNNRAAPSLTAVLDYSLKGAASAARFGEHRSKFGFPLSDEWKAWQEFDGKPMKMAAFAEFLEDHIADVLPKELFQPGEKQKAFVALSGGVNKLGNPYELLEVSKNLQVFETSEVSNAMKLQSGESQVVFRATHTDGQGGEVKIPAMFAIAIPVFVNGEPYQVLARLRYRKVGAELNFIYDLWRTDIVFDHAFDEAVAAVSEKTGLPVLLGRPEA